MAYVPGYEYDLFVSYAHDDDVTDRWVTLLVERLEKYVRQRLGGTKDLNIFRDGSQVTANFRLDELLTAVQHSALFLAVGSPSYVAKQWTKDELNTFAKNNEDLSRLFAIECLPVRSPGSYPIPLNGFIRDRWWIESGERRTALPLSRELDFREYETKMHTLAQDISNKLAELRVKPHADPGAPVSVRVVKPNGKAGDGRSRKRVLMAQSTEEDEAEKLRSTLLQFDDELILLPEGEYPGGGSEFRAAFQKDLESADLVVQLLGKRMGRRPPDLPEGYTVFQADAARKSGVPFIQWRAADLNLNEIQDTTYREMLQGAVVLSLVELQADIRKRIRQKPSQPPPPPGLVFIDADRQDFQIAKRLETECLNNAFAVVLPALLTRPADSLSAEDVNEDLADNLKESDALVFIYGESQDSQRWINRQLKYYGKYMHQRESQPRLLAIYSGPPPDKAEPSVRFPNARYVSCPTGWDIAPLLSLLKETVG